MTRVSVGIADEPAPEWKKFGGILFLDTDEVSTAFENNRFWLCVRKEIPRQTNHEMGLFAVAYYMNIM
jgi:hypothetical protein